MKLPTLASFNMQRIPSYFTIVACKEKKTISVIGEVKLNQQIICINAQ